MPETEKKEKKEPILSRIKDFIRAVRFVQMNGSSAVLRDGGTSLYTKVIFKEMALKELQSAMRNGTPVSLLMADMDGLTEVNNRHGHQKGDAYLKMAANIIKETLRESDIVGRYGGDEFIAILPGTDKDGAEIVVQKLKNLLDWNMVGFSFGVAEVQFPDESQLFGSTRSHLEAGWKTFLENLIDEADENLYRDKAERKAKQPPSGT
jgi:diguanylate cyclase (GGDEF)-like protein